jgi:hypothetical protein
MLIMEPTIYYNRVLWWRSIVTMCMRPYIKPWWEPSTAIEPPYKSIPDPKSMTDYASSTMSIDWLLRWLTNVELNSSYIFTNYQLLSQYCLRELHEGCNAPVSGFLKAGGICCLPRVHMPPVSPRFWPCT